VPTPDSTLVELADAEGAVHVGWVGSGVLYVRRYAREDGTSGVAFDDYKAAVAWLEEPA
jgi:hypothetical protein